MPRFTDNLGDKQLIDELCSHFVATKCGKLLLKADNSEVKDCHMDTGYIRVYYKGRMYMKHRLIYAIINGPYESNIDHIDRDKKNNAIDNLRLCCQGLNVANSSLRSDNTTGYIGVIWHKASNKWQAQTMLKGKRVHIGLFSDIKEAALAYNHKLTEIFGHQCTFNKVFEDHPDAATETSATNIGKTSVAL